MSIKKRYIIIIFSIIIVAVIAVVVWLSLSGGHPAPPSTTTTHSSDQQPSSEPPKPVEDLLACVNALPTNLKIGQKIMAASYAAQIDSESAIFATAYIGGVLVMNQTAPAQLTAFRDAQLIAPFIAVDQEGGTVQRYTSEGILPGAFTVANSLTPAQAYDRYLKDATYLKSVGITTNFAPVVDVISRSPNPLPGRMFSTDPTTVTSYASMAIKAAKQSGITPVIKHFPGLGSATGNTDFGNATTDSLAILQTRDLVPYRQLASLRPDVMVNNAIVPDLTNGQPATWAPATVNLLRSEGYSQTVVYSDSLTANAVPGSLDNAVVKAWQAGIDVAVIVQGSQETASLGSYFQTIITRATAALESGELNTADFSASIARIFARKGINPCQVHI